MFHSGNRNATVYDHLANRNAATVLLPFVIVVTFAVACGVAPIEMSVLTVFLFAGPHNWMEARYFLARTPARWGRLSLYFGIALIGAVTLSASFAALPWLADRTADSHWVVACWNSLLIVWVMILAAIRSRHNPRREWPYVQPLGFLMLAAAWLAPFGWSLLLVYLHPILALVFVDRELTKIRSPWGRSFRLGACSIPLCLIGMAYCLAQTSDLRGTDVLTWQITRHAGGDVVSGVSSHLLVSTHVFLELLHYLCWIILIPMASQRFFWGSIAQLPLARRSTVLKWVVMAIVASGAVVVILLWASFIADYAWTRNVYFTIAILHVLLEIPFLLRSL